MNQHCFNSVGSYKCSCKDGFEANGVNCKGKLKIIFILKNRTNILSIEKILTSAKSLEPVRISLQTVPIQWVLANVTAGKGTLATALNAQERFFVENWHSV